MTDRVLYAHFRWAGGTHRFALPMEFHAGLPTLPQKHGISDPQPRLSRLLLNANNVADVVATIRGGLIGGKAHKPGEELDRVVLKSVLQQPLAPSATLAKAILLVAIFGIPKGLADTAMDPSDIVSQATDDHVKALEGVK